MQYPLLQDLKTAVEQAEDDFTELVKNLEEQGQITTHESLLLRGYANINGIQAYATLDALLREAQFRFLCLVSAEETETELLCNAFELLEKETVPRKIKAFLDTKEIESYLKKKYKVHTTYIPLAPYPTGLCFRL
jgi:hypothetical protein